MKRTGNLFDKICTIENFKLAYKKATQGKKHYKEVIELEKDVEGNLQKLLDELKSHKYKTSEYHIFKLWSGGKEREVYKLPMKDRIVQHALMNYMEPIFRKTFITDTYSSIKGRGIHKGLYKIKRCLKDTENTKYCLKMDILKFYPSIDLELLKRRLRWKFKDPQLLLVLDEIVSSADRGVPIGNYTSLYFANFFLTPMDHWIKELLRIKYYFRYCDDIVILSSSKNYLRETLVKIVKYLSEINLKIKPNWLIFPILARGIDFLGYIFKQTHIKVRKGTKRNFIKKLSLNYSISKFKRVLGSYWGIFCHANCKNLWYTYTKHKDIQQLFKNLEYMRIFDAQSNESPKPIEQIGPKTWRVRWDIQKIIEDNKTVYKYREADFKYKPFLLTLKTIIPEDLNKLIDASILEGFTWKDMPIWLSTENQFNYKAAYDLAVQTEGATLPVTFKFGTTNNPVYYTFETVTDLTDFYVQAMNYINACLKEGWDKKDSIDWSLYDWNN